MFAILGPPFPKHSGGPVQWGRLKHELALALREIRRIERALFIIDWLLDADMQRRANIGLNKGEAHHALKNALRIGRQGEIRDRTAEGPTLPHGWSEPARRHHHLEHQTLGADSD